MDLDEIRRLLEKKDYQQVRALCDTISSKDGRALLEAFAADSVFATFVAPTIKQKMKLCEMRPTLKNCPLFDAVTGELVVDGWNAEAVVQDYNTLNAEQQTLICEVARAWRNPDGGFIVLSGGPGMGKSYVLSRLMRFASNALYCVNLRVLTYGMLEMAPKCSVFTFHKLCMILTKKNMTEVNEMYVSKNLDENIENLKSDVTRYAFSLKCRLIIIDETSVLSTWQLLLVILSALSQKAVVVLTGDALQQQPFAVNPFFKFSNERLFEKIGALLPSSIRQFRLRLKENQRIRDPVFKKHMLDLTELLLSFRLDTGAYVLHINILMFVYERLKDKFFEAVRYDDMLITSQHRRLSEHLDRYVSELKARGVAHDLVRAYCSNGTTRRYIDLAEDKSKYRLVLVLSRGEEYTHINVDGKATTCTYVGRGSKADEYVFRYTNRHADFTLTPQPMHMHLFSDNKTKFCRSLVMKGERGPYVLPIVSQRMMTFASCQGVTLSLPPGRRVSLHLGGARERDNGDRCNDAATGNSFYVALSRVRDAGAIGAICTTATPGLMLTEVLNDGYYYQTPDDERLTEAILKVYKSNPKQCVAFLLSKYKFEEKLSCAAFDGDKRSFRKISKTLYEDTLRASRAAPSAQAKRPCMDVLDDRRLESLVKHAVGLWDCED